MYYLPKIFSRLKIPAMKNCVIAPSSKVLAGCSLINVTMGKYSFMGRDNVMFRTEIGAFCSIAANCVIGGGEHPTMFVSTSPVFHSGHNCLGKHFSSVKFAPYKNTVIGNDVWIGNNCLIKSGVTIGTGAVVGMGSVVTHDIPPYEIWAGNPARKIRDRFDKEIADRLLESKWWDKDDDALRKAAPYFDSPVKFLEEMERK